LHKNRDVVDCTYFFIPQWVAGILNQSQKLPTDPKVYMVAYDITVATSL